MTSAHGGQRPVSHHLRISHTVNTTGEMARYMIVQSGSPVDRVMTYQLSSADIAACESQLSVTATSLDNFVGSAAGAHQNAHPGRFGFTAISNALTACLPRELVNDVLGASTGPLTITTDRPAFPWHLISVHGTFLGIYRPVTLRLALNTSDVQTPAIVNDAEPPRALLIGNPRADRQETETEIAFVSKALSSAFPGIEIVSLLQADADKVNVQMHLSQRTYQVIHYAGHARFDDAHGGMRGLWLADGHFSLHNIHTYPRARTFVFLNACHGGAVTNTMRNNSLGFTYVGGAPDGFGIEFVRAGARAFIAPMWPVYDGYARAFAERFYTIALTGVTLCEALQRARAASLRERPNDPTWATYVLYADSEETLLDGDKRRARSATERRQPEPARPPHATEVRSPGVEKQPEKQAVKQAVGALRGDDPGHLDQARRRASVVTQALLNDHDNPPIEVATDGAWVFWQLFNDLDERNRHDIHALDLLIAICERAEDSTLSAIMLRSLQPEHLKQRAQHEFEVEEDTQADDDDGGYNCTNKFIAAVRTAAILARIADHDELTALDLALALLKAPGGSVHRGIRACRADENDLRNDLEALQRTRKAPSASTLQATDDQLLVSLGQGANQPLQPHRGEDMLDKARRYPLLYVWGWTERSAHEPPPTGASFTQWNNRVFTLASELLSDNRRQVALVGPAGVGKWTTIYALALALSTPPVDQLLAPLVGSQARGFRLIPERMSATDASEQLSLFLAEAAQLASKPAPGMLLLAVANLSRYLTAPNAHDLLGVLRQALGKQRIRLICTEQTAHGVDALSAAIPEAQFSSQRIPALAPADTLELLAGYAHWLQREKPHSITFEPAALNEAAHASLPKMAQPGLGVTLAREAMRNALAGFQGANRAREHDTIIHLDPSTAPTIRAVDPAPVIVTTEHIAVAFDALRH